MEVRKIRYAEKYGTNEGVDYQTEYQDQALAAATARVTDIASCHGGLLKRVIEDIAWLDRMNE